MTLLVLSSLHFECEHPLVPLSSGYDAFVSELLGKFFNAGALGPCPCEHESSACGRSVMRPVANPVFGTATHRTFEKSLR